MKLVIRITLALVAIFVLAIGSCVTWIKASDEPIYEVKPTGITASTDAELIARGEYLFHGAMHCSACHMGGDIERALSEPPGTKFVPSGGYVIEAGPFGTFRPINLTNHDTGIAKMSDEHIARVIKHGVGEDGRVRPFMTLAVGTATDEDIRALVSYMRSLAPVDNDAGQDEYGLIGEALVKTGRIATKTLPTPKYAPAGDEPSVARGEYLAKGPAFCVGCHSPLNIMEGGKLEGEWFSGCFAPDPAGDNLESCPPNLTPSAKGMTTLWTEEQFLERTKKGYVTFDSKMPWGNYAAMTDSDLRSIWRYLAQLAPVERDTGPGLRVPGTFEMP
jgi:mono/diheme cytochrome c family protein